MSYLSPIARTIVPYTPGEQPRDKKYIKLNTNENAYTPSPKVGEALKGMADELRLYPDADCTKLRGIIARRHGLAPENVFVGNGSDEVLALAFQALIGPEKGALSVDIGYTFYPVYAALFSLPFATVEVNEDLSVPCEKLMQDRPVVLANPNAPTSLALSRERLCQLAEYLRGMGQAFIVDEAYCDFGGESMDACIKDYDNLLVVRTMSKSHALAGMRVGYALGAPELIDGLNRIKNSFNSYPVDRLAQAAAAAALEDERYFENTCAAIIATRETFIGELKGMGFSVPESRTNFVFPKHERVPAKYLFDGLRARGILVRYFDKPRLDDRLRITIGTVDEMRAVADALRELVDSYR